MFQLQYTPDFVKLGSATTYIRSNQLKSCTPAFANTCTMQKENQYINRKIKKEQHQLMLLLCTLYLSQSFPGFFFRNISLSDVLLEWREKEPEQGNMFPKQACRGNATWVKGSKCYARVLVVASVELLHAKHVADFAILVGLGTIKVSTINHCRAV